MEPGSMEEASATVEVQVRAPKGSKGAEDVEKGQDNAERGQAAPIEPPREDLPPANSPLEVSFADMLFKHADRWDLTLLGLGVAGSVLSGVLIPVFTILFGNLLNNFWGVDVEAQVNRMCLFIFFIAIASFVGAALEVGCLKQYAARQAHCVRGLFLRAYLRQDIAFVDAAGGPGRVMQGLNDDADAYQAALGDKLGNFIHSLACFISAIVIAFWRGWDIALVMLSSIPALALVSAAAAVYQGRLQAHASAAYGGAASITQQALSNVRTVAGYGLEERTVQAYQKALTTPAKVGVWQGLVAGLTLGSAHFTYYGAYGLAVWYGSGRVADGDTTPGYVVNVLLSAVLAGFGLGQAIPFIPAFQRGRAAAADLFAIIARRPAIDLDGPGETLSRDDLQGNLELRDVVFAYPATPDRPVLRGFNLSVSAGRSVALVGESGCGKSTVIALIQRFHDPQGGQVLLDGRDVRDLQLRWMREQMGLVTQEPVLFSGSIRDNIAIGAPDASERQIVEAASAANSYGFILKLPLGLDTLVGEQGSALSGGQKQRIAIARALLRNPKVLLLDEATSALDAASEKAVQDAVDALVESQECTVVLIAHRLSTVKGADTIAVVKDGAVVEQGCHEVLVEKENGLYRNLVARQQVDGPEEGGGEGDDGVHAAPQPPRPSLFRWLRDSILHRGTVRLSVIPESVRRKLGASAGDDPAAEAEGAENREGADKRVGLSRLAALQTRREWRMGALAFACSAMAGLQMPIFALSIASVTASMFSFDPDGVRWGGSKWGLVLTGVAVGCLLFEAIQGWSLAIMGQNLACRVRTLMLRAVLKQDIGWFDQEENSSSAIASRMSNDAAAVRGACGDSLGLLVQNLSCLIAAYAIGFTSSWSVTLVASAVLLLMVAGQAVQAAVAFKRSKKDDDPLAGANQLATEATASIRTVAAFSLQEEIASRYTRAAHAGGTRAASAQGGLAYGLSMLVLYSAFSLGFWFGGREVLAGRISFRDLLRAFLAIFYCAFGIAHAQAAFPEVGSAGAALPRVFGIIDRPSPIDPSSAEGATFEQVEGAVEFRDVTFAYPARPGRLVFKHLSLEVPAGTSCALVGESGHGKSTLIALLERFYDPTEGQVLLDGVDLRSLSVRWLRAQLGLVSQDCVLFAGSVADNIRIGAPGAPLEQVQAAAKTANAFNFVAHLPAGFATRVGEGGLQLSGGQKQRIAIARALLRNPKILLLDEATSALDAESEAAVLDGLATAMVGRTTLLVAHRLTTVCCATKIAVIHRGRVLEQGSHEELAAQRGYYSCLLEAAAA